MTKFDPEKLSAKNKAIVFFAIILLAGIPMWITDYAQYSNSFSIPGFGVVVAVVSAGMLAYYTSYRKSILILVAIAAHMIAFLIKVFIDCKEDPTNHNLVPFELVFFIFLDGVGGSILTVIIRSVKKIS